MVRHVVVPGLTDNDEDLEKLAGYVSRYKVIQKAELLPYHTMEFINMRRRAWIIS